MRDWVVRAQACLQGGVHHSFWLQHCLLSSQTHPGTVVTVLDLFDGRESLRPMWEQVQGFREAVAPIMAKATEGVHLICYSQGRLFPSPELLNLTGDILGFDFGPHTWQASGTFWDAGD